MAGSLMQNPRSNAKAAYDGGSEGKDQSSNSERNENTLI
jgi:hypothetical protein